jgi:hypothetical protein
MKANVQLGLFITFILLAGAPKNRSVDAHDIDCPEPDVPRFLPLTRYLETALERVRGHELPVAHEARPTEIVFRIGTAE